MEARSRAAFAAFKEAVLDLVDEPTPANARRYLAASCLLARATEHAERAVSPGRRNVTPSPAPASSAT